MFKRNWRFLSSSMKRLSTGALLSFMAFNAQADIKVGILHSLTGTMAVSETALKDTMLMLIEQQNAKGGVLGQKLVPVIYDPSSNWDKFGKDAEAMLSKDKVDVIFGCWTSVSRKHVLPVVEQHNGLLFYPVQYEGEEQSPNIFYTGATPNQQAIPAVDYMLEVKGAKKFYLLGTDYVYPRTTNNILYNYLLSKGIPESDIIVKYTPFGFSAWSPYIEELKEFGANGDAAVISTVNGDANVSFYKMLSDARISSDDIPVIAFSVGENEIKGMNAGPLAGHLVAWNYFMSLDNDKNEDFIDDWHQHMEDDLVVTNDPMEATYIGFNMWIKAVEKAGTTDTDAVRDAIGGIEVEALSGFKVKMDEANHHLHKPVYVGEIQSDGQIKSVWESGKLVDPAPFSPFYKN